MRFYGTVGYASSTTEEAPGVWVEQITERSYYGDVIANSRRLAAPSAVPPTLNESPVMENSFSIVGDAEAYDNYANMRYVEWNGSRWTVTDVQIQRPRLILRVGELWVGNTG